MEIQFGEGGEDSKIFVHELFAAYVRYAKSLGLTIEDLHITEGHLIAKVTGKDAGKSFQYETGNHVVQRVSPTETKGRRHTSLVSVAVLPIYPDVEYEALKDQDLEVTTQRGHGPGGQHQNVTDSAVRMRHKPTGLMVFINGRDQHANKREALKILTARVNDKMKEETDREYAELRKKTLGGGSRGEKVRTYNFLDSRVTDHRLNVKTGNIKAVMKGDFNVLFDKIANR